MAETVRLTVLGGEKLTAKAGQLRAQAKTLQRRIVQAADEAVNKTYQPALKKATLVYMPDRYAHLLNAKLRVKTDVSFGGPDAGVGATVTAPTGGAKGRDVPALERGVLAHPLFGNKHAWYRDRIKRGFAADTLKKTRTVIVKRLDKEIAAVRKELE